MQKFLFIFFLVFFINLIALAQPINKKTNVKLLDSSQINISNHLILVETDSLIITTTYSIFSKHLRKESNTNNDFKIDYDSIFNAVRKSTLDSTKFILDNLSTYLMHRLNYIVGDLLQKGKCLGYNKISKRSIKKVKIIDYGSYIYGRTGKKYFLNNILLMDNTEMIF